MGKEKVKGKTRPRVVLDTNVFISAMLFCGQPSQLVSLWQRNEIVFLVSSEVMKEYLRVLSYPKFRLGEDEIKSLIEVEVTPFIEPVKTRTKLCLIDRDPSDNKFLELAVDGKADAIVSSDKHLLDLKTYEGIEIIPVAEFLKKFGGRHT
jgi:putative PIN family toxin of toxin-antitoxin system